MGEFSVRTAKLSMIVLLCVLFSFISHATAQKPTPTPERPRQIVSLLNDARLAAPELTVDTFVSLVESKKVSDPIWRKEILEEAWRLTGDVKYPVRMGRAYYGTGIVDTVSGYMTYAYDQKLDAMSLQARIIKALLGEDRMRAREIVFQVGGDLKLKPLTCEDSLAHVVDDIYATVGAVAKAAFGPTEIAEGVRGLFLLPWIENIQSPSQIMPLIELLNGLQGPAPERQMLINAFERSINRNFADDRSFSRAFLRDRSRALSFMWALDDSSSLRSAWRDYLAKNAAGPRCLDSKPAKKDELPWPVNSFNSMFAEEKRFSVEDFASVEYRGVPKDKLYLDSPTYKKVILLFKTARETKNRPENKDEKSSELEWQIKITEVLELLDSWKASPDESEAEVFNQKTVFYRTMTPEVGDTQMKTVVVRAFMRYLAGSSMQKDSFIEWLVHARWLAAKEPELFRQIASEVPNHNFNVMLSAKKLLAEPNKNLTPGLTSTKSSDGAPKS